MVTKMAIEILKNLKDWNIEDQTGYKPLSTFYKDFSLAERFGREAIKNTALRLYYGWWKDDKYLTELVLALQWKAYEHEDNEELSSLYGDLYEQMLDAALSLVDDEDYLVTAVQMRKAG